MSNALYDLHYFTPIPTTTARRFYGGHEKIGEVLHYAFELRKKGAQIERLRVHYGSTHTPFVGGDDKDTYNFKEINELIDDWADKEGWT